MADRNDESQYPQNTVGGNSFYGDTTMDNDVPQENVEATYAEPSDFLDGYEHVGPAKDYMAENPGKFRTVRTKPAKDRVVSQFLIMSQMLESGEGNLAGFSLRETSEVSDAVVTIHDGIDSGAAVLMEITLAPGESTREWYMPVGIFYRYGLYFNITGSVRGNVFKLVTD